MFAMLFRHAKLILVWGVLVAILSAAVSLLFPWQYSAQSQVLIISRDRSGVDPYTQSKAAERIGENLAQVMQTDDFKNKVLASPTASFDKTRWTSLTDRKQKKQWQKDVAGQMVYGTSLMNITVYSTKEDVLPLATTITETLTTAGWEYVGGDVAIKTVNQPIVSAWITRPNILFNGLLGFLAGVVLSCVWVIKYRRHLFGF
ncbi:MAG: Wzz/FepE/Etk N-terminal domain-containing protein [Candidatus Magasanikbacteria bacterium]|jgi:capsular polysaccharide biosynthesis protein